MESIIINNHTFSKADETPYSSIYFNERVKLVMCVADDEYIPIENFKMAFEKVLRLTGEHTFKSFLFDKRKLRTFHQPSMEWYFSVWKPLMREKGLYNHYKILPDLMWFEKAVEAGKHEIFQKFGKDIVAGISIKYVNSIEEAIADIEAG